jgi:tRNA/tmRNA/rRNA uracil-C5-methylase (TrmA/RlmC/RlmD family)
MLESLLPWHSIPISEQLARKKLFLARALQNRGFNGMEPEIVPSPLQSGYRARVKMRSYEGKLGFFKPGTHEFVAPDLGAIAIPPVVALSEAIESVGFLKEEAELRSDGKKAVLVLPHPVPKAFQSLSHVAENNKSRVGDCILQLPHPAGGLRASPLSFYQVNLEVNRLLVEAVDRWLLELKPAALLDMYGGIGNLSVLAARRGVPVVLLESSGPASADARYNLGKNAKIIEKDAGRYQPGEVFFDVALLDPPRSGLPIGLLSRLSMTLPRAVLYVSCDPVTLARDLEELKGKYELKEMIGFDMFPGTEHLEALAVLLRK